MIEHTSKGQAAVELAAITQLIDDNKPVEALDAYERWMFKWEKQIVDIGGTAHLKFHQPSWRRRKGGRR